MTSLKVICVVLCCGLAIRAQAKSEENNNICILPNNETSICVPTEQCEPIKSFLQETQNLTQDVTEVLKRLECGFDVSSVKFCCPKEPLTISNISEISNSKIEEPTVALSSRAGGADDCRLPNGNLGDCVPIRQCGPVIAVLRANLRMPNPETINGLRKYHCPSNNNDVKVCCPNGPILISSGGDGDIIRPSTPDVGAHRNLNMLPLDCGVAVNKGNRVTRGNQTGLFEFPWMALLSYQTNRGPNFLCAGTIINPHYILTAAHCVHNQNLIGIRVGEHNIPSLRDCDINEGVETCAPPVQDKLIEDKIVHPNYKNNLDANDIALLRLRTPIEMSDNTQPVCLPTTSGLRDLDYTSTSLIVTGWGITEKRVTSDELLKVAIPIISLEECRKAYQVLPNIKFTYTQFCGLDLNGADACKGDSGGPLQKVNFLRRKVRYVQFGIVSFGPVLCGNGTYPGVYTRVDYFMDWILDNLKT